MKYGVQMYLFRSRCRTKEQTLRTIRRVADMGWDGIELFQSADIPAERIRSAAGSCEILNPMLWPKHFEPARIQKTCDWLKALGAKTAAYNTIPVLHTGPKAYRQYNPKYVEIAKTFDENALTFCHHNHKEEYRVTDGRVMKCCLSGEGVIPLREILSRMEADGYAGTYALEFSHPEKYPADLIQTLLNSESICCF